MTADRELSPAKVVSTGTCLQLNGRQVNSFGDDEKTDCDVNVAGTQSDSMNRNSAYGTGHRQRCALLCIELGCITMRG